MTGPSLAHRTSAGTAASWMVSETVPLRSLIWPTPLKLTVDESKASTPAPAAVGVYVSLVNEPPRKSSTSFPEPTRFRPDWKNGLPWLKSTITAFAAEPVRIVTAASREKLIVGPPWNETVPPAIVPSTASVAAEIVICWPEVSALSSMVSVSDPPDVPTTVNPVLNDEAGVVASPIATWSFPPH